MTQPHSAEAGFRGLASGAAAALGTIVSLPEPQLLEIARRAGCDWVFVDCEHGAIATSELASLLVGSQEVPVAVRLPANQETYVKQALDAGAAAIICPLVEDAAMVRNLVSWAKYPPVGTRSVGIGRAHGYGLDFAGYLERANDASSVIVQIESAAGISALDDILDVAGIGGIFIGPYDLSASMGYVGRPDAPVVVQAIRNVIDSCRARGVPVGQFFANAQAYKAAESAHLLDFVAIGLDTMLLARSLESQLTAAR